MTGCLRGDASLVRAGLRDCLVEPRRAPLVPGFAAVQSAALSAGALGCTLSGAGPSMFAWYESASQARTAAPAMQAAFQAHGVASQAWVAPVAGPAAAVC